MIIGKARVAAVTGLVFLLVLLVLAACASQKTLLPTNDISELVGNWVNRGYTVTPQRIVVEPDGIYVTYRRIEDTTHAGTGVLEVVEKWRDRNREVYFKIFVRHPEVIYELDKISKSGAVWEFVQNMKDYPLQVDPDDLWYRVYYRQ